MEKKKTKKCKYCHAEIPVDAKVCPSCGKKLSGGKLKWFIIILVVILILGAAVSVSSSDNEEVQDAGSEQAQNVTEETDSGNNEEQSVRENEEEKEDLLVTEETIYEGYDTVIQTTGEVSESWNKIEIGFYFENNSDLNLKFYIHSYAINGIMADEQNYISGTEIPSGKKSSNTLSISKSWLDECGIEDIEYIDLLFWAYDNDKNFKEFETDAIRINTNFYAEDNEPAFDQELFSENGIEIGLLSLEDDNFSFAVMNETGSYFDFDIENTSVNDWSFDTGIQVLNEEVLNGCMKICNLKIDSDFREANQIESVEKVEFGLSVRTSGSYSDSYSIESIIAAVQ